MNEDDLMAIVMRSIAEAIAVERFISSHPASTLPAGVSPCSVPVEPAPAPGTSTPTHNGDAGAGAELAGPVAGPAGRPVEPGASAAPGSGAANPVAVERKRIWCEHCPPSGPFATKRDLADHYRIYHPFTKAKPHYTPPPQTATVTPHAWRPTAS